MDQLVDAALDGDVRALGRLITRVENGGVEAAALLRMVYGKSGRASTIGLTGAPGVGKSTLADRLIMAYRAAGKRVAVVAVDPTSPFSGGAILGDRIRMEKHYLDSQVFIRSMATRGHLGGIAATTVDVVDVLDAAGYDVVLVETIGVGQDAVDIAALVLCCLLVLTPSLGDEIQAMKGGIMEVGDVYVVNKADREGADRMETHLRAMLGLYEDHSKEIPILRTVATRGQGIPELALLIGELWARRADDPVAKALRAQRRLEALLRDGLFAAWRRRHGSGEVLESAIARVLEREIDPHAAVEEMLKGVTVDHLGIAVRSSPEALAFWRDGLGLRVAHEEIVASEGVSVTMLPAGESRIELLEPLPGDGPVQAFLQKRGPGIHHACFGVPDIEAALARLRAAGAKIIGEAPRRGAGGKLVAFVHPSSTGGVLVELSQDSETGVGEA